MVLACHPCGIPLLSRGTCFCVCSCHSCDNPASPQHTSLRATLRLPVPSCLLLSICTVELLHGCVLQQHCLGMRRVRHLALRLPEECPALSPLWALRWLCRSGSAAADCGCGSCLPERQSATATAVTRKAEPRPATLPVTQTEPPYDCRQNPISDLHCMLFPCHHMHAAILPLHTI